MWLEGKFSLTASRAGRVMTASPTQLVARINIRSIPPFSIFLPQETFNAHPRYGILFVLNAIIFAEMDNWAWFSSVYETKTIDPDTNKYIC